MQFVAYESDSENETRSTSEVQARCQQAEKKYARPTAEVLALGQDEKETLTDIQRAADELPAEWLIASDSSDDLKDTTTMDRKSAPTVQKKFEDVATLLSSVTEKPKFLKKKIDEDIFVVAESRSHNYDVADKDYTQSRQSRPLDSKSKPSAASTQRARSSVVLNEGALKPSNFSAQSIADKEKENAKVQKAHILPLD